MKDMIPVNPPKTGEKWDDIFNDVERVIMPGVSIHQTITILTQIRKKKFKKNISSTSLLHVI
jgi:hypothetical protein